jgi:hypothetical protein
MIYQKLEKYMDDLLVFYQKKKYLNLIFKWKNNFVSLIELDYFMKNIVRNLVIIVNHGFNLHYFNYIWKRKNVLKILLKLDNK